MKKPFILLILLLTACYQTIEPPEPIELPLNLSEENQTEIPNLLSEEPPDTCPQNNSSCQNNSQPTIEKIPSKYAEFLIEEDINNTIYKRTLEVSQEIEIENNIARGYQATYIQNDIISTITVWDYFTENKIKESLERTMFQNIYARDKGIGDYLLADREISLITYPTTTNTVYSYEDHTVELKNYYIWTNNKKIIKAETNNNELILAYLEKHPSDFTPILGCYDTDGGDRILSKGFAIELNINHKRIETDSCLDNFQLSEKLCENKEPIEQIHLCPGECDIEKGLCVDDTIPPRITNLYPQKDSFVKLNYTIIQLDTHENSNCTFKHKIYVHTYYSSPQPLEITGLKHHEHNLSDFKQGEIHFIEIECLDRFNNSNIESTSFTVEFNILT